jgi:copper chaperone CopZ
MVLAAALILAVSCGGDADTGTPESVELAVVGMHCTGCEDSIRESVGGLEGVDRVEADHARGRVVVDYRSGAVTVDQVVAAVEELGFEAAPVVATPAPG